MPFPASMSERLPPRTFKGAVKRSPLRTIKGAVMIYYNPLILRMFIIFVQLSKRTVTSRRWQDTALDYIV